MLKSSPRLDAMSNHIATKFQKACGSEAGFALQVIHQQGGEPFQQSYSLPFAVIGRNPRSDLYLDDQHVSSRHAYLQMVAGRLLCIDLESLTGVYWAEERQQCGWVDEERGIRIGPYQITKVRDNANGQTLSPNRLLTNATIEQELSNFTLSFGLADQPDKAFQKSWQLDRMVTFVGKTRECKVRFAHDPSVSSYHCCLLQMDQKLWVVDLLSRTGTELNGTRIRWSEVRESDELKVGKFLIRIHRGPHNPQSRFSQPWLPAQRGQGASAPPVDQSSSASGFDLALDSGELAGANLAVGAGRMLEDSFRVGASSSEGQAEFWRSLLTPLFQQFSLMQQQMFDQFQNTLLMITQTLNAQQQHQFSLIREELGHLRELNQELSFLHTELAKHKAKRTMNSSSSTPATLPEGRTTASNPVPSAPVSREPRKSKLGNREDKTSQETNNNGRHSQPQPNKNKNNRALPDSNPDATPTHSQEPNDQEQSPPAAPKDASDPDEIHRQMTQRLRDLQQKRQSLWEKILRKITGR